MIFETITYLIKPTNAFNSLILNVLNKIAFNFMQKKLYIPLYSAQVDILYSVQKVEF